MKNPFFQEMSAGVRAILFGSLILICAAAGSMAVIALGMSNGYSAEQIKSIIEVPSAEHVELIKWMNNLSQISTFLLPVGIYLLIFGAPNAFRANMSPGFVFVIMSILWMMFSGGVIDGSARLNEWLIPQGSFLEEWFLPTEKRAEEFTYMILDFNGIGSLMSTFFCIALIPAICEELAFRGVLQPLLIGATRNIHAGVWLAAFVFSFFHFQFYGFLPRLILGAMLGYIFVWSGGLWVSIVAHLVNNTLAIAIFHYNGMSLKTPEGDFQNSLYFIFLSVVVFFLIGYFLWKKRIPQSGWLLES